MSAPEQSKTVLCPVRAWRVSKDGDAAPVDVDLSYGVNDPWAVGVTFWCGDDPVDWEFARDLLRTGVLCASGEGDITIAPHPRDAHTTIVDLTVRYPNRATEHAEFHFDVADLAAFLLDTELLVPVGSEAAVANWDAEFAQLARMWD